MEESRRNVHIPSATLLFSPFIKQAPLFCFTAPVHHTNSFQDFSTTISKARFQHSILDGFSSAHTYSPSWLLSFPSYCTIRMTRWDLLHCRRILNNPERRWHSQLWMGPVQTPLSCWKDKLRSDWCGGFQQGTIKNKIKTGGEKVFWRQTFLFSEEKDNYFEAALKTLSLCRNRGWSGKSLQRLERQQ